MVVAVAGVSAVLPAVAGGASADRAGRDGEVGIRRTAAVVTVVAADTTVDDELSSYTI